MQETEKLVALCHHNVLKIVFFYFLSMWRCAEQRTVAYITLNLLRTVLLNIKCIGTTACILLNALLARAHAQEEHFSKASRPCLHENCPEQSASWTNITYRRRAPSCKYVETRRESPQRCISVRLGFAACQRHARCEALRGSTYSHCWLGGASRRPIEMVHFSLIHPFSVVGSSNRWIAREKRRKHVPPSSIPPASSSLSFLSLALNC